MSLKEFFELVWDSRVVINPIGKAKYTMKEYEDTVLRNYLEFRKKSWQP